MEEQRKNNFILGVFGAIVGAFIGTIPWILVYIFGNMIIALLSIIIAVASHYGYKVTRAKIDKKLPVVVALSSVFAVTVATFVIIPLALLRREGYVADFENLKIVYDFNEFKTAIIHDYIISLIFTAIGISGIVANLHKQIKEGVNPEDIKLNVSDQKVLVNEQEFQAVREVFVKNDALNKYNGISKEDVIADLSTQITELRAKDIFAILKSQGVIKKSNGKYYFNEKAQNSNFAQSKGKRALIVILVVIITIVVLAVLAGINSSNTGKNNSSKNTTSSSSTTKSSTSKDNTNEPEEEYETEHKISGTDITFVPSDDLLILTESEIKKYVGAQYASYEIIAMNIDGSRILYCFIDGTDTKKDMSAKEYIEAAFEESERSEIKSLNIAETEFQSTKVSFEDNEGKYAEDCYVAKIGDKFLCFDYVYPEGEESNFENMLKNK